MIPIPDPPAWTLRLPIAGHWPEHRLSVAKPVADEMGAGEAARWRHLPLTVDGCDMIDVRRAFAVVRAMVPALASDLHPCSMTRDEPPVVIVTRENPDLDAIWDDVLVPLVGGLVAHEIVAAEAEEDCSSPPAESCTACSGEGGHHDMDDRDEEGVPAWETCDVCNGSCLIRPWCPDCRGSGWFWPCPLCGRSDCPRATGGRCSAAGSAPDLDGF